MAYTSIYAVDAPKRAEVDAEPGSLLIEFGTSWCGHCLRAQPFIELALSGYPELRFLKFEDGPGRLLGRSFRVKQWPTLILMRNGQEVGRIVRPDSDREICELIAAG
jgi:thioredoxin 1